MQCRLRLIRQLPFVAWLRSFRSSEAPIPGAAFDIDAYELEALVREPSLNWSQIIDAVRPNVIQCGSGAAAASAFSEHLEFLGTLSRAVQQRGQEVVSLDRAGDSWMQSRTLRQLSEYGLHRRDEMPQALQEQAKALKQQLVDHGENRLTDHDKVAREFTRSIGTAVGSLTAESVAALSQQICRRFGVPADRVTPDTTVGEIGEMAIFAGQLRKLASRLGFASDELTLKEVPPNACPSWVLRRELRNRQAKAERVQGGDLNDAYLAAMVLYIDLVQVDKRTHEQLRQIVASQAEIASHCRNFTKLRYFELLC